MLGKLLKYEIAATARIFLPIYGLILLLAGINKVLWPVHADGFNLPHTITMTVYVMLIVVAFVITLVVTIQRFYRTLLCDEGYLSFTLPVKPHSHIDAKMIVTLIWSVLSVAVSGASVFILVADADTLTQFSRGCAEIGNFYRQYGLHAHLLAIEFFVLVVIGFLSSILQIYASIVTGNLAGRHKLLAGIGAYLGFGIVEQLVTSMIFNGFSQKIEAYFKSFSYMENLFPARPAEIAMLALILYLLVFGLAYYFFTDWMLSRKLNLE